VAGLRYLLPDAEPLLGEFLTV